jgi:two-component system, NtrC family, sensor histidine kinase HydH
VTRAILAIEPGLPVGSLSILAPDIGPAMECARFNLRLWFAAAGFIVIATLSAAFAVLMSHYLTTTMLDREVAVTQEFLESILATEGYGERVFVGDGRGAREALESFADHVRAMPEIMRANVYGADRSILWSTDRELIGRRFENNPELDQAMAGSLVREIGQLRADSKPEHIALGPNFTGHFIEAYIPFRGNGMILGVVEIYKVPVALETAIDQGHRIIGISAAIGALVLFATLYWIVRRGALQIQRQQAELGRLEGLAAVGQMASAVAHSLRNPLSGIRSSAELLRLEYPMLKPVPDEIIGEVDRLDQCVRELMDYARSDTVSVRRVEPLDLVRETVERQRVALDRARVVVTIDDARRTRRPIAVDPPMLGQAMVSIITNAIEALPDGGNLRIVLSETDHRHTLISFTDSGSGIPTDLLPRISEPFFTTKIHGLGLGLALARRIVERFNGTLDILSSDEGGAMLRIKLAAAR